VTWDDTNGQWWRDRNSTPGPNCRMIAGDPREYFQPPVPRRVPEQMNAWNIFPYNAGNYVQALMCDGSVRTIGTTVSIRAWSAGVTPKDGESESQLQ
jgi:hypothetical protein